MASSGTCSPKSHLITSTPALNNASCASRHHAYASGFVKSMMPDGGGGVSTVENGEVAAAVSQSMTHGSPVAVLSKKPLIASSANNGEWIDTYGYSQTQIFSAWRFMRASVAGGSG